MGEALGYLGLAFACMLIGAVTAVDIGKKDIAADCDAFGAFMADDVKYICHKENDK